MAPEGDEGTTVRHRGEERRSLSLCSFSRTSTRPNMFAHPSEGGDPDLLGIVLQVRIPTFGGLSGTLAQSWPPERG
jgi:hypothetical protein